MKPITVVLQGGEVFVADRLVAGNQGLILYLVHDRVLFLPVSEDAGRAVRRDLENNKVIRIEYQGTPVWLT